MDVHLTHPIAPPLAPDILVALQAVAEPTRARIVALLGHGEHCVCDVGEMLGLSPALVSHHLRALRTSGLLRERRSGRWVYYSLELDRLASLRAAVADLPVAHLRRTDPRRIAARKNAARASVRLHLGAYAAMVAIVLTVWLAVALTAGAWYFWPIWPILGGAIGVVGHALPVRTCCR